MSKRKFTEEEVKDLVFDGDILDTIEGEDRRWSRTITKIVNVDGKTYSIWYESGLTEYQENEYFEQEAPEVKKIEKQITVSEWVEI